MSRTLQTSNLGRGCVTDYFYLTHHMLGFFQMNHTTRYNIFEHRAANCEQQSDSFLQFAFRVGSSRPQGIKAVS